MSMRSCTTLLKSLKNLLIHGSSTLGNLCENDFKGVGIMMEGTQYWISLSLFIVESLGLIWKLVQLKRGEGVQSLFE